MSSIIHITDNSGKALEELKSACNRALESCGQTAEGYAKARCPVDTGALRNSISHKVDESSQTCYIGTDMEYAPYVELGTGVYCTTGGGRAGWWVYVKGGSSTKRSGKTYTKAQAVVIMKYLQKQGLDAQITQGSKPQPYLKPALEEHTSDYRSNIESELKRG